MRTAKTHHDGLLQSALMTFVEKKPSLDDFPSGKKTDTTKRRRCGSYDDASQFHQTPGFDALEEKAVSAGVFLAATVQGGGRNSTRHSETAPANSSRLVVGQFTSLLPGCWCGCSCTLCCGFPTPTSFRHFLRASLTRLDRQQHHTDHLWSIHAGEDFDVCPPNTARTILYRTPRVRASP
jgi:hypothetical protein